MPSLPDPEELAKFHRKRFQYLKEHYPEFDAECVEANLNIIRTNDMLIRAVAAYLRPFGLTPPSMGMLILLESAPHPLSMRRLSGQMIVTQANVTGIVDTLEKAQWVKREPHPDDRRVTLIRITAAGRKKIRLALPEHLKRIRAIYAGLSKNETRALKKALKKVRAGLMPLLGAALLCLAGAAGAVSTQPPAPAKLLSLKTSVTTALSENPSLADARNFFDRALSAHVALLGRYDTSLAVSLKRLDAKTPPAVFFLTPRMVTESGETSLSKRFATGTLAKASASLSREKDDISSIFTVNPRARSKLDLSFSQSLLKGFVGMPERSALKEAEFAVRAAQAALARRAELLAGRVSAAYWELWRSREQASVLRESQEEAREFLATTKKLGKSFEAEKDDLLRAEADLLSKELKVLENDENTAENSEALRVLMAADHAALTGIKLSEPGEPTPPPAAAEALECAVKNRRDLAARGLEAERDRLALAASSGLGLPSLDLTGSWGWSGLKKNLNESAAQTGRMGFRTWSVGLSLSYAFGAKQDRAKRLSLESTHLLSMARSTELHREIEREVFTALRRLALAGDRVRITRRLSGMQGEALKIAQRKYRQGRISSRDRLQAANAALEARSAKIGATAAWAAARDAEKTAEGGLLNDLGIEDSAYLGSGLDARDDVLKAHRRAAGPPPESSR